MPCLHTGPTRGATVAALFPYDATLLPEVPTFVTVFKDLLLEGLKGADLQDAVIESVPASLFISHPMISSPAIYHTLRKDLAQSVVQKAHTALNLPRNAPVVRTCVMAIWGAEAGKESVSECIRTQKVIIALLSSPSHSSPPLR